MTFKYYIDNKSNVAISEKALEIKRIAEACMVDISTVYRWLNGKCLPDPLKMQKLSEITGISVEQLFPDKSVSLINQ